MTMMVMMIIMVMMIMMIMIMRMKTICDVINESKIKVKVVIIMSIELGSVQQSKEHLFAVFNSALILKTSFIELEKRNFT